MKIFKTKNEKTNEKKALLNTLTQQLAQNNKSIQFLGDADARIHPTLCAFYYITNSDPPQTLHYYLIYEKSTIHLLLSQYITPNRNANKTPYPKELTTPITTLLNNTQPQTNQITLPKQKAVPTITWKIDPQTLKLILSNKKNQ